MIISTLLFLASVIPTKPSPVFAEVFVGGKGPFRFLVDTGSQTSLLDPKLAERLGLKAQFRVEMVTQLKTSLVPGMRTQGLRVGKTALPELELVFQDLTEAQQLYPAIDGLLGLNALAGFNFMLTPGSGRLELGGPRPLGPAVPFTRMEDRIALKARMGNETLDLILDSGSTHVVLFRKPAAMAKTPAVFTTFGTLEGARAVVPTAWTADLIFSDRLRVGMQPAAIVPRSQTEVEGLLPAALFKRVYVDQARGEVVLLR